MISYVVLLFICQAHGVSNVEFITYDYKVNGFRVFKRKKLVRNRPDFSTNETTIEQVL